MAQKLRKLYKCTFATASRLAAADVNALDAAKFFKMYLKHVTVINVSPGLFFQFSKNWNMFQFLQRLRFLLNQQSLKNYLVLLRLQEYTAHSVHFSTGFQGLIFIPFMYTLSTPRVPNSI